MSLSLFLDNCNLAGYYEEDVLTELTFHDTVVIDRIYTFLQDEAQVAEELDREPTQYVYALEDAPVEVHNNFSSQIVVQKSQQFRLLYFIQLL